MTHKRPSIFVKLGKIQDLLFTISIAHWTLMLTFLQKSGCQIFILLMTKKVSPMMSRERIVCLGFGQILCISSLIFIYVFWSFLLQIISRRNCFLWNANNIVAWLSHAACQISARHTKLHIGNRKLWLSSRRCKLEFIRRKRWTSGDRCWKYQLGSGYGF